MIIFFTLNFIQDAFKKYLNFGHNISVLHIFQILFIFYFILQNTHVGSSQISLSGSTAAGNTSGMPSLEWYAALSLFFFLIISSCNWNHLPFSMVFRLEKSQKSQGAKRIGSLLNKCYVVLDQENLDYVSKFCLHLPHAQILH